MWIKEIKYSYWSKSHHWCVHLFLFVLSILFCCFGPRPLASPQLDTSQGCPEVPTVRPHVGPAGQANAGGPYHTGGQRGTDCPPPRPATGDRGPAKVSGGAHFLFACSYLTLVNCFSSASASLGEICPRTRGSRDKYTHTFFFLPLIFLSTLSQITHVLLEIQYCWVCTRLNFRNEIVICSYYYGPHKGTPSSVLVITLASLVYTS